MFVCKIYGKKKLKSVDEARLDIFLEKQKPSKGDQRISSFKNLDGSALPPCSRVSLQKINRTHLVALCDEVQPGWIISTRIWMEIGR